ncbi:hypothetical protein N665_0497s0012 [Sinapis alba]|nr:hypothetical protein N665_0497s0012 [Sinapis alba]
MLEPKRDHPRLILHNSFLPKSAMTSSSYTRAAVLTGRDAMSSPHLIISFVSIREWLKERVEETFGCEYELFIEFTGLISWCRGDTIKWHSDDNIQYPKQRDFSGKDFKGGLFRFQSGEPATIVSSAGDDIMYTADDRNIHSVDEVTDGERLTLAMWLNRDSSLDEDSKLVSRLSSSLYSGETFKPNAQEDKWRGSSLWSQNSLCTTLEFGLSLLASTSMYWFCPHQDANQNIGFDICVVRLHLLGLDVHSLHDKDRSLEASEQLMGPIQIAKGGELLTLHARQVVQFCHWKSSELKTSMVENDTVEELKAMPQPQLESINALKSAFLRDEGLVTKTFGYSCFNEDQKDSLDLRDTSVAITSWEEYTYKLFKELLSSLPQWKTY